MSKVYITGRDGYISKYFLENSDRFSLSLISISRKEQGGLDLYNPSCFDYSKISKGDFVIFSSAISSPDTCYSNFREAVEINVSGTLYAISRMLQRGAKVVFLSSDVVYGSSTDTKSEESLIDPNSLISDYANMKYCIERVFMRETNVKILRLSFVASHEDSFVRYIRSCVESQSTINVYSFFVRNIVSIEDVFQGIQNLTLDWNFNNIINFSGPESLSRLDMLNTFFKCNNLYHPFKVIEPPQEFLSRRPRVVKTSSLYFQKLLQRTPASLSDTYSRTA